MTGKLSIVGTPIGNLEDITLRALRALKEAEVVYCEDTRVTAKLLARHQIKTPLRRLDANIERTRAKEVVDRLAAGECVAYVSDAGTPGISDPGAELVARVREALPEAIIEAIPGASSLAAALSIAGLQASSFIFYGFLPQKKGRETLFKEIAQNERASIFYESPHRIMKALESLKSFCPGRRVGLFRELTKLHEQALIGTPEELIELLTVDPNRQRGEFVVIVEGE